MAAEFRTRATISPGGTLHLSDLPFREGDVVEVVVLADPKVLAQRRSMTIQDSYRREEPPPEIKHSVH